LTFDAQVDNSTKELKELKCRKTDECPDEAQGDRNTLSFWGERDSNTLLPPFDQTCDNTNLKKDFENSARYEILLAEMLQNVEGSKLKEHMATNYALSAAYDNVVYSTKKVLYQ
jgi:hypothetical protein